MPHDHVAAGGSTGPGSILEQLLRDPRNGNRFGRLRYPAGAYICHAGDAGDRCFFIRRGRAAVLLDTGHSERIILNIVGPGDTFGELALLRADHVRTATIQALDEVETVMIRRHEFEALRREEPRLDDVLLAALADRVYELSGRLSELASVSKKAIVHRCLLRLGRAFDALGPGGIIPLSQTDVASVAGVGLRTTTDVLKRARDDGLLVTRRGSIEVLDWDAVRQRADFRPYGLNSTKL